MNKKAIPPRLLLDPAHLLSLGFGTGLAPFAPGTFGTIIGVVLYILAMPMPIGAYLITVAVGTIVGIWLCGRTSAAIDEHDHPGIVWDEIVGYWITMIAVPQTWYMIIAGFILFRIFDIWKPWPIKVLDQKIKGGFGIMVDDIIAGIFSLIMLHVIINIIKI